MFGRNITWLLSTEIEYRFHIAYLYLVNSDRPIRIMKWYFLAFTQLRVSCLDSRRLLVRDRVPALTLSSTALWTSDHDIRTKKDYDT